MTVLGSSQRVYYRLVVTSDTTCVRNVDIPIGNDLESNICEEKKLTDIFKVTETFHFKICV